MKNHHHLVGIFVGSLGCHPHPRKSKKSMKCEIVQENCKTHPQSTPQAIPRSPIMKGIPAYSMLVKVARGVFQFGVLKQPLEIGIPKLWENTLPETNSKSP